MLAVDWQDGSGDKGTCCLKLVDRTYMLEQENQL